MLDDPNYGRVARADMTAYLDGMKATVSELRGGKEEAQFLALSEVLTGEEDHRTPMSESEQYFAALQLLGVESVFVRVPGEPHGIRARPSHHAQKMAFIVGWFDRHRKEAASTSETGAP